MCRNMLLFGLEILYSNVLGISLTAPGCFCLRYSQMNSFAKATGLIFLTEHAMNTLSSLSPLPTLCSVIPHGVSKSFFQAKPKSHPFNNLSPNQSDIYINH